MRIFRHIPKLDRIELLLQSVLPLGQSCQFVEHVAEGVTGGISARKDKIRHLIDDLAVFQRANVLVTGNQFGKKVAAVV